MAMLLFSTCAAAALAAGSANNRPVIGVMAQPTDGSLQQFGEQYIVASYVKWIEAAGARVVPVLYNQTQGELAAIFAQLSGLVFPGGHCGFHGTAYGNASWALMQLAVEANDRGEYFPLWGTCMGFQQLLQFGSGRMEPSVLNKTPGTEPLVVPVDFTGFGIDSSRLMGGAPAAVKAALQDLPITVNLHNYGALTTTVEQEGSDLHAFFSVVANNRDADGVKFVSMAEARKYPFYGTQFHGEKNAYEWDQGWEANDTDGQAHSPEAVAAMQYLSDFFVGEARRSPHKWDAGPWPRLIYDFAPMRTGNASSKGQEQCYLF